MMVVVVSVRTKNVVQLAEAETEEVVEDFSLTLSDPAFGVTVCDRTRVGRANYSTIGAFEVPIEAGCELGVPIMDQEPHIDAFVFCPHRCVASLLAYPTFVWTISAG